MMTVAEITAVIKAHRDGKLIQTRYHTRCEDDWADVENPEWNFCEKDYRVKPRVPVEFWFEPPPPGVKSYETHVYTDFEACEAQCVNPHKLIKVRRVDA